MPDPSTRAVSPSAVVEVLADRLRTAVPALLPGLATAADLATPGDRSPGATIDLLGRAVRAAQADLTPARVWLLLTVVRAAYPTADEVRLATRQLELVDHVDGVAWLLDSCLHADRADAAAHRRIELVVEGVVVDVDLAAKRNYHTGIQQVIRNTMPRWDRDHEVRVAAWTGHPDDALRGLGPVETDRVLRWHGRPSRDDAPPPDDDTPAVVLVPWRSVVVVADIPTIPACTRLGAIGEHSDNSLVVIGYDAIPVVSTHLVPVGAADHHAKYLACIKRADRVATISATARAEFAGFAQMLPSQGLVGPAVSECMLPADRHDDGPTRRVVAGAEPVVLTVGSLEPRKNHVALFYAAEVLWREGHRFRLQVVGGNRWGDEISDVIDRLHAAGRPLDVAVGVDQADLEQAFVDARFTVFASLHEGYGLPVAESLAFGTPVLTSGHGSTAEIAAGGGALLVDPRDDDALVDALRRLLTDDDLLETLRAQIPGRATSSWDDYARQLWDTLVAPGAPRS